MGVRHAAARGIVAFVVAGVLIQPILLAQEGWFFCAD